MRFPLLIIVFYLSYSSAVFAGQMACEKFITNELPKRCKFDIETLFNSKSEMTAEKLFAAREKWDLSLRQELDQNGYQYVKLQNPKLNQIPYSCVRQNISYAHCSQLLSNSMKSCKGQKGDDDGMKLCIEDSMSWAHYIYAKHYYGGAQKYACIKEAFRN